MAISLLWRVAQAASDINRPDRVFGMTLSADHRDRVVWLSEYGSIAERNNILELLPFNTSQSIRLKL